MKKTGTLNGRLSWVIAGTGHGDRIVVCDSGLPVPRGTELVDLALAPNIPRFLDAVRVILEELHVEGAVVASESRARCPDLRERLEALLTGVEVREVPHEEFKAMVRAPETVAVVRTGEATPYANVILISGVTFG